MAQRAALELDEPAGEVAGSGQQRRRLAGDAVDVDPRRRQLDLTAELPGATATSSPGLAALTAKPIVQGRAAGQSPEVALAVGEA